MITLLPPLDVALQGLFKLTPIAIAVQGLIAEIQEEQNVQGGSKAKGRPKAAQTVRQVVVESQDAIIAKVLEKYEAIEKAQAASLNSQPAQQDNAAPQAKQATAEPTQPDQPVGMTMAQFAQATKPFAAAKPATISIADPSIKQNADALALILMLAEA